MDMKDVILNFYKDDALNKELKGFNIVDTPQQQFLSAYEVRRQEINESNEPIEGIFYIYNDQIVPDYYSECLFSQVESNIFSKVNKQNPRKCAMYHTDFFKHYIRGVYEEVGYNEKFLPRGRVLKTSKDAANMLIDGCYFNDKNMIRQLVKLYRLSGDIIISTNMDYQCVKCKNTNIENMTYMYSE